MKTAWIVVACDCDPDSPARGGVPYDSRTPFGWRGIQEGIPRLVDIADEVAARTGVSPRFTWCVRADAQIEEVYGEAAWALREFSGLWKQLATRGDEIGWHPHVWRWDGRKGCWYQEIQDEAWIKACLRSGFEAMEKAGTRPYTTRMGWEFHNNLTMQTLDALGIRFDLSAVPGSYQPGEEGDGSCFHKFWDWRGTPCGPYHPSRLDYRRPAQDDHESLRIWEIPRRAGVPGTWRFMGRARKAVERLRSLGRSPGTSSAPMHACCMTLNPAIFRSFTAEWLRDARTEEQCLLVVSFHADELLPGRGLAGWKYGPRWPQSNLLEIVTRCENAGLEPRFATPQDMEPILHDPSWESG